MNIGLSEKAIKTNLENLDQYLADLKVLSTKTQGYHWNIIDPGFHSHHKFFEELYGVQLEMIDGAAERMRKLGAFAPADMTHFVELSTLESDSKETSFQNMMKALVSDVESIIVKLRSYAEASMEEGDETTADFYIEHGRNLEKMAWMLRSSIA